MIETIPVNVRCKREEYAVRTCYILASSESKSPVGISNGCDFLSGDSACNDCVVALSKYYNDGGDISVNPVSLP